MCEGKTDLNKIAGYINLLGNFCGKRDLPFLTPECMEQSCGISQADVMVLFGGSILCGGDVLADAMKERIAKQYIIVGGAGHTTEALRQRMGREYPSVRASGASEAELFDAYLRTVYGKQADYLETGSTNCGNNITNLLELLREKGIPHASIILMQDATMQCRMDATLRKYAPEEMTIINYAAYRAEVTVRDGQLAFTSEIKGMWDMDRYITLLMGEIPRLTDDEAGYGPQGKGFLAHMDIPAEVQEAFAALKEIYGEKVRKPIE